MFKSNRMIMMAVIFAVVFVFLIGPVAAQEPGDVLNSTETATIPNSWMVIGGIIGTAIVALLGYAMQQLSKAIPPEFGGVFNAVLEMVKSQVPVVIDNLEEDAQETETPIDDLLVELAKQLKDELIDALSPRTAIVSTATPNGEHIIMTHEEAASALFDGPGEGEANPLGESNSQ